MQVTMCLPSGTPAISLISGFTAAALTKKPLKKVPRPSALAMSSMFEDASDAFTSENAVVIIIAGALQKSLSFSAGLSLYFLYMSTHIFAYILWDSFSGDGFARVCSPI